MYKMIGYKVSWDLCPGHKDCIIFDYASYAIDKMHELRNKEYTGILMEIVEID